MIASGSKTTRSASAPTCTRPLRRHGRSDVAHDLGGDESAPTNRLRKVQETQLAHVPPQHSAEGSGCSGVGQDTGRINRPGGRPRRPVAREPTNGIASEATAVPGVRNARMRKPEIVRIGLTQEVDDGQDRPDRGYASVFRRSTEDTRSPVGR